MINEASVGQRSAAQGSETTCVQKIANISNAQRSTQMKLSLKHNWTPLNTPVWFICPCSFAHMRKNTTENFAPRESRLALIVGSRSWWQTKAASFLLAPRSLECLVTGNLATKKTAFLTGTQPPVLRAGRVPWARTCCYRRAATWSPFCFDVTMRSLLKIR